MPPQHGNSIEMRAPAEWKPYARRAITRSLLLMLSTGPFVIRVSRYARMPSAWFRIVRPSFTNGAKRDRAAHSSYSSSSSGASSDVA